MMKEATKEKQWVFESIIDVKNFIIKTKQPDAKTQC